MISQLIIGASATLEGLRLIHRPGLRRYVYIPFTINLVFFGLFVWLGVTYFGDLMNSFLPQESWFAWLHWLLWPLFAIAIGLVFFFCFSIIANLIGAPFNSLLAKAVEQQLTHRLDNELATPWQGLAKEGFRTIKSEINKMGYFISRAIPLLILFLIPGINIIAPFLWFAFNSWMLALEYLDYPMGNHGIFFTAQRDRLRQFRGLGLGFGASVVLMNSIPLINFLAMPTAVASATLLWVKYLAFASNRN
ncbi:sulfate transporter CysZ [Candidatus Nitrosacidococcus tergens]|uniref:Sulfate transporter CysZ n=1 Tax=Candidatus Nitrosacidococcus tergens TaxID=553981 RepID=A0A7G1Q942_9GAMM|nr:sulfate transporter CysZ [Candidatus Nitrosacidococcus tergens]CAB1275645.1 Protein CysZ homolog [Candidatus Nitrosacidococcus tergens]